MMKGKKDCIHHWVIETANGPTSQGVCAVCGSSREFCNSMGESVEQKKHLNLKSKDDEPSNARTPWMNLWPSSHIQDNKSKIDNAE